MRGLEKTGSRWEGGKGDPKKAVSLPLTELSDDSILEGGGGLGGGAQRLELLHSVWVALKG